MTRSGTTPSRRGVTPSGVVHRESGVRLRRYEPTVPEGDRRDPPLVVVYAVVNRPYVLDLHPDRSVVRQFLDRGFDVSLVDWGSPSALDTDLGIADYAGRYLPNCVDAVADRTGAEAVHLLGYCTGGTLAAVYAALAPDRVRTLVQLAPLLSFDAEDGIFRFWGREDGYDRARLADVFGNAPGPWLTAEFAAVAPVEFALARYVRLADRLDDPDAVARFVRRHRWRMDPVDVAGRLFREFVDDLYRDDALLSGTLTVHGRRVDVGAIDAPVLAVAAAEDQFVPEEAGRPFLDAVGSDDTAFWTVPTDHVGLSVSERAHADLWPRVCDWLAERSTGRASGTAASGASGTVAPDGASRGT